MDKNKAIHANSLRVVSVENGLAVGIDIVTTDGDRVVVTMSGEGLLQLQEAIREFVEQRPVSAGTQSPRQQ